MLDKIRELIDQLRTSISSLILLMFGGMLTVASRTDGRNSALLINQRNPENGESGFVPSDVRMVSVHMKMQAISANQSSHFRTDLVSRRALKRRATAIVAATPMTMCSTTTVT